MKTARFNRLLCAVLLCLSLLVLSSASIRATIILNGDFEAGNTGFSSEYTYVAPGPGSLDEPTFYTVDTDPRNNSDKLLSIGDHTTGTGLMLIVNGDETPGTLVWLGTTSSPLTVGQQYDLSFWVAAISTDVPPALTVTMGSTPLAPHIPVPDGSWNRSTLTFTAEEAYPKFRIDAFAEIAGNDFAIDDIDVFLVGTSSNPPVAGPLVNISTRMQVLTDDQVLIGGFIVTGDVPKPVILRAVGPSLGAFSVTGALADPVLELRAGDGSLIMSNDNWKLDQQDAIAETGLAPSDDLESAIVATLDPGSYTAIVRGKDGGTGIGLIEAYDLEQTAASQLANISTRGFVQTGNNVMIGGFILGGEDGTSNVLVRAIGPTLTAFGVAGALADPSLELRDGQGTLVRNNDNWKDAQEAEIDATGLAPQDELESAILETLDPGAYTAIVTGTNGSTGVGLVEVYRLP